jgi:DNA-directed RNA polymerase subunit RPC12/RpoP
MPNELKHTKYFASEYALNCPYCGETQGWTFTPEPDELESNIYSCRKCKKEFIIDGDDE